ncbi:MAG: glycosyltransferase family 2 protein [Pyrinomonadaceae bacterium]|nr:glycosyltransferase family 2 protein [Pyrinomonadaceae bacterium]
MKISATIITLNEEHNIERAIRSLSWADEIVVVDSCSNDRTAEIARSLGAKVTIQEWLGFSKQKQFAADLAANEFIFSLDADEEVSSELAEGIEKIRTSEKSADGYKIPRLSFYMNRAIRHGGWYPDRQLRLFDKRKGHWNDRLIHESVKMDDSATVEVIHADIFHYSVEGAAHHHKMIGERYAPLAAKHLYDSGKTTSPLKIAAAGPSSFFRSYFLKMGILDGLPGFAIAKFAAHHSFLKHLILWELQNSERTAEAEHR